MQADFANKIRKHFKEQQKNGNLVVETPQSFQSLATQFVKPNMTPKKMTKDLRSQK